MTSLLDNIHLLVYIHRIVHCFSRIQRINPFISKKLKHSYCAITNTHYFKLPPCMWDISRTRVIPSEKLVWRKSPIVNFWITVKQNICLSLNLPCTSDYRSYQNMQNQKRKSPGKFFQTTPTGFWNGIVLTKIMLSWFENVILFAGVGVPSGSAGPSLSTLTPVPTATDSANLKYGQPGGDTLSDFVTLVCQEAQNAGAHSAQVRHVVHVQDPSHLARYNIRSSLIFSHKWYYIAMSEVASYSVKLM